MLNMNNRVARNALWIFTSMSRPVFILLAFISLPRAVGLISQKIWFELGLMANFFLLLFTWVMPAKSDLSVWLWNERFWTHLKQPQMHCKYASIHPLLLKWKILPFQLSLSLQIFLQYLIQGELIFLVQLHKYRATMIISFRWGRVIVDIS